MPFAVLIDTVSIQDYIFSSNKLKENIGASYIIENLLYRELIPVAISEIGLEAAFQIDSWKEAHDHYQLDKDQSVKVEVGFVGGGNALLLFKEDQPAKDFIKTFSRLVLQYFPGVRTAYAMGDLPYDDESFPGKRRQLYADLAQNKSRFIPQTTPFKHGIVEDCPLSNEGHEDDFDAYNKGISKASFTKLGAEQNATQSLEDHFQEELKGKYGFTAELDKLGQADDKGYVAIVHADGNNMGHRFQSCKNLGELRKLSQAVGALPEQTMKKLIAKVVELCEKSEVVKDIGLQLVHEQGKTFLPIRPVLSGGDDITFVCEGKLGIFLAEKLVEFMLQSAREQEAFSGEHDSFSACVGVAIVHTKYPFYRAYSLAEELIKEAKNASRKANDSWLSYMISTDGFSGELEDVIRQQYTHPNGKWVLRMSPYKIDEAEDAPSLESLKKGIRSFHDHKRWPRNKQKALRDILRKEQVALDYFKAELAARELHLPAFGKKDYHKSIWIDGRTPYFDMVELTDFYPEKLL